MTAHHAFIIRIPHWCESGARQALAHGDCHVPGKRRPPARQSPMFKQEAWQRTPTNRLASFSSGLLAGDIWLMQVLYVDSVRICAVNVTHIRLVVTLCEILNTLKFAKETSVMLLRKITQFTIIIRNERMIYIQYNSNNNRAT